MRGGWEDEEICFKNFLSSDATAFYLKFWSLNYFYNDMRAVLDKNRPENDL